MRRLLSGWPKRRIRPSIERRKSPQKPKKRCAESATRAAKTLRAQEERAAETLDENMAKVRTYVEKNPLQSAGIAFAAGVLVSMLLRR